MIKSNINILYEDNHIIIVNKFASDIVQKDKTGDITLADKVKSYIKEKYNKPGDVFLGITHRIDRPTSGIVVFARTSKSLTRLNNMFKQNEIHKTYWAIVEKSPENKNGQLKNYLKKNESNNKSYIVKQDYIGSKLAILNYKLINKSENYYLLEVKIETGRHHQIRAQLANINCIIKGDVKYGAKRANIDKSISLHAREIEFIHPVSNEAIHIIAPVPNDSLWNFFDKNIKNSKV